MSLLKRTTLTTATVAVAALTLAACGLDGGGADPATGDDDAAEGEQEVTGEVEGEITFQTMQLTPTFHDFINGLIADCEDQYTDVSVQWVDVPTEGTAQKIYADATSGNVP